MNKDIEIYGADFTTFKELEVDQKTNGTYLIENHFYKKIDVVKKLELKYMKQKERKFMKKTFLYVCYV